MLWSGQLPNHTEKKNRKSAAITVQLYAVCIVHATLYLNPVCNMPDIQYALCTL